MTPKQFRLVLILFAVLIVGQHLQTALLLHAASQNRRAIESADASAMDALEVAKEVRARQEREPGGAVRHLEIRTQKKPIPAIWQELVKGIP